MMIIALGQLYNGFRTITRTVSDHYENGFRSLRERFQITARMLLERFEDV